MTTKVESTLGILRMNGFLFSIYLLEFSTLLDWKRNAVTVTRSTSDVEGRGIRLCCCAACVAMSHNFSFFFVRLVSDLYSNVNVIVDVFACLTPIHNGTY